MISTVFHLILYVSTVIATQSNNNSCLAITGPDYPCEQYIYSPCKNASLLINKPQWNSCKKVQLFWDQPMYNLTITFIPPSKFRQEKLQSYKFCLEKDNIHCSQAFYLFGRSKIIPVKWIKDTFTCFKNKKGMDYFTFQFQSGDRLNCYSDFIRYSFKQ